ncbi:hypothetical protein ACJMK2_036970 [Sinanodonta woodiana]|uniref:Uncharacterized protein n=1 Tax=Sinanodonta woodiana TaxID=1069815 RepID=A0ABD3WIU0_SINWO
MEMICLRWIQDGPIRKESETVEEKINKLESQMKTTLQTIELFGFKTTLARNEGGFLSKIKSCDGPGPIQSSIGVAVCFVIGLIVVPLTLGLSMLVPIVVSSVFLFVRLRSILINRMARISIQHAKVQPVAKAFVHDCFEMPYTEKINKLKNDFECSISFIHKTIIKMEKDARNKRNPSSVLHELKHKIKDVFNT